MLITEAKAAACWIVNSQPIWYPQFKKSDVALVAFTQIIIKIKSATDPEMRHAEVDPD